MRLHIHAVVNKEAAEICISKWTLGEISRDQPLSEWKTASVYDWTRLANYIINQSRTIQDGKRYTISRNLEKPELKDRIAKEAICRAQTSKGRYFARTQRVPERLASVHTIQAYTRKMMKSKRRNEDAGISEGNNGFHSR